MLTKLLLTNTHIQKTISYLQQLLFLMLIYLKSIIHVYKWSRKSTFTVWTHDHVKKCKKGWKHSSILDTDPVLMRSNPLYYSSAHQVEVYLLLKHQSTTTAGPKMRRAFSPDWVSALGRTGGHLLHTGISWNMGGAHLYHYIKVPPETAGGKDCTVVKQGSISSVMTCSLPLQLVSGGGGLLHPVGDEICGSEHEQ